LVGKYIVLYAGAHGMSNDLQIMLAAADMLRSDLRISFLLVGDGKEKPNLIQQAHELKLGNVHFLPPVPKKEMPQLISNVDACLAILKPIPMYATVYPNKVFDYMASGKPVILAIEGVMREVIEQARAGIAVHPGDQNDLVRAVKWLVENLDEGKRMGGRGRAFVEKNFDRNQLAERLFQLMQSLVKEV
jgi:glycosyltransferase involved in cell wall biosynthesis